MSKETSQKPAVFTKTIADCPSFAFVANELLKASSQWSEISVVTKKNVQYAICTLQKLNSWVDRLYRKLHHSNGIEPQNMLFLMCARLSTDKVIFALEWLLDVDDNADDTIDLKKMPKESHDAMQEYIKKSGFIPSL